MNIVDEGIESLHCANHPDRETVLRCGKCGKPICTRCTVPTPVGSRCPTCANLKRLPQFNVSLQRLGLSALAGLGTSALGWYVLTFIPFLRILAAFLVGVAVSDVMGRVTNRRSNLWLEVAAVGVIVLGWVAAEAIRRGGDVSWAFNQNGTTMGLYVALPIIIASYVTVIRLR